jgi:mannose-6-phosphate isomerase
MSLLPVRLEPSFVEKVWGTTRLSPWFADSETKIGEVWFPAEEILVKFIYTTENLSVQVHPPGKTEMWHILRAEPGASIALGFRQPVTKEEVWKAALSGEIEQMLEWVPVSAGDSFLNPVGTVHALGGGMVLCEVQQNYPVTYRLYDYGRPRELHLDQAMEVLRPEPHPGKTLPVNLPDGGRRLIACDYFVAEAFTYREPVEYTPSPDRYHLLVILEGSGTMAGQAFAPGELWRIPAGAPGFSIRPESSTSVLKTYVPEK